MLKCRNPQPYYHSNMDLLALAVWDKFGESVAWEAMREICQDADGLMMRVSARCDGNPADALRKHREALLSVSKGRGVKVPQGIGA